MEGHEPAVLIIDDRLAVARGTQLLLRDAGLAATVCPDNPDQALAKLRKGDHDVALVELRRRAGNGVALAREALQAGDAVPVVLCTASTAPRGPLLAASRLGAPGLVLTSSSEATLLGALRTVANGGTFVDPEAAAAVAQPWPGDRVARLSPREWEVMGLLADGYAGPEIAEQLFLSLETVRTHIRNAAGKLEARTRVQAAAMVACAREEAR